MTLRLKNESGFALILTLVITALMVAIVVEMIHQVYVDTTISRGFRDRQQASILAESGVMAVKTALSMNVDPTLLSVFLAKPLSDEVGSLEMKISNESGKININGLVNNNGTNDTATKDSLSQIMNRLNLPGVGWSNILNSVAFWIDKIKPSHFGRDDSIYYSNLKPAYSARNDKLMTLTELTLVRGITPAMLDGLVDEKEKIRLRDCLTIYPSQTLSYVINVNSAPKAVLMSLGTGMTESVADQIINTRPFASEGEFSKVAALNNIANGPWLGRLKTTSNLYRITAVARVKESVRTVEAVVSGGMVLSWQEN